jgi:hypothetical protein
MARAPRGYPAPLHHLRWCRNGAIPDAGFQERLINGLNHVAAYRKKVIGTVGQDFGSASLIGTTNTTTTYWRFRCKTGFATTQLRFKMIIGVAFTPGEFPTDDDPLVRVNVNGADYDVHYGSASGDTEDSPDELYTCRLDVPVSPDTTYAVTITGHDGARPLGVCAYEFADPTIALATAYYYDGSPAAALKPIYAHDREAILDHLSRTWTSGGAPLLTWFGRGDGTARSITGTTWTNLIDGSSTSVAANSPGWRFDAVGSGDGACSTLLPLVPLNYGNDLPVSFEVYGNASASGGEARLVDSGGVGPSITGITTTLQWWTTTTTWQNVDAIASGKVDLQGRHSTAGQTVNIYAACVYPLEP